MFYIKKHFCIPGYDFAHRDRDGWLELHLKRTSKSKRIEHVCPRYRISIILPAYEVHLILLSQPGAKAVRITDGKRRNPGHEEGMKQEETGVLGPRKRGCPRGSEPGTTWCSGFRRSAQKDSVHTREPTNPTRGHLRTSPEAPRVRPKRALEKSSMFCVHCSRWVPFPQKLKLF